MNMNFTWKQAETLSPGQLAIQGVELATKVWGQFVKFMFAVVLGFFVMVVVLAILAAVLPGSLMGLIFILFYALFLLAVMVGAIRLSLAVVDGKMLTLKELFALDGKMVGTLILAYIVYLLAVFVGTLALIVPGIMIAIGCSFALYVIIDKKDVGPIQALKASWAMTNGDLLSIALLSTAVSLILYVAVLPAYEIGAILVILAGILKSIHLGILVFIPVLLGLALAIALFCAVVLVMIGGCLSYAIAYRKLSQTRSSAMEAAMKE